jgi:hypothetical protein
MGAPSRISGHAGKGLLGACLLALVTLSVAPSAGCSSSSDAGSSPCGSPCAAGSACIDDGTGANFACRAACTSSAECAPNTYCNDAEPQSWCAASTVYLAPAAGQWGAGCVPSGGEAKNPSCDVADGFACYGVSPTDATAFCTLFGCEFDTDCPGTWWCARVNQGPNVTSSATTVGITRAVCLPREYCAPCQRDHDCAPASDGTPQHCVADAKGNGHCTPACATDNNCALDATCQNWESVCTPSQGAACKSDDDCAAVSGVLQHCNAGRCAAECAADSDCAAVDGGGAATCQWARVCTPRAGVCLGDGSFCSPCRSDADCKDGDCISALPYSTERFCSVKSTSVPCDTTTANPTGCPTHQTSDNWRFDACATSPVDQCEGFVVLGTSTGSVTELPGCWTVNR